MNAKQKRSSIFVCGQNNFDQLWAECLFLEVNNIWTSSEWQRKINGHRQNISVNNETAHENEMFTFVSMAYSANDFGTMRTLCRPTWMNNTLEWCEWALLFNNLHRWHRTQTQPKSQTFSFIQHICTYNDSIQRWLAVANRFNGFSMNSTTQIKPNLKIILNQRVDEIAIIDSLWLIEKREEKIHLIASTNGKKECYNHFSKKIPTTPEPFGLGFWLSQIQLVRMRRVFVFAVKWILFSSKDYSIENKSLGLVGRLKAVTIKWHGTEYSASITIISVHIMSAFPLLTEYILFVFSSFYSDPHVSI